MPNRILWLLACLMLMPLLAHAGDYACGTADDTVSGGFRAYLPSVTPEEATAQCPQSLVTIPAGQVTAQRDLVRTTDPRKLRLDLGANLVVLKSLSVRNEIDAADAAAAAEAAALAAELQSAGCRADSLADAEQKIRTQMQVARAAAQGFTNLETARSAALTHIDKAELLFVNIARCFFALVKTTR